eukprot:TRINITY_DN12842_c0_g1_i1.p1 TRINITY_DN12842_c0_g1~~TRINITY_DN12842_c0_g1_i1.p1  ORF type:complete len:168 (-),score=45.47 TRINITY_DN12842_c0_g1_i1:54-557(-)
MATQAEGGAKAANVKEQKPKGRCVTVRDVPAAEFIAAYAQHLKRSGKIIQPRWTDLVKTSSSKEMSPQSPDWFYVRAAAVARRLYMHPELGLGGLRRAYGDKKRNGPMPGHYQRSSGSVLRAVLKELTRTKIVEKSSKDKHGRRITRHGQRVLDRIAGQVQFTTKAL